MRAQDDRLLYLGLGPLAAIALGVVSMPLREWTTASNLTFVFLVWTILVGELGGRSAAVATALTSGLSLNFFLTRPYLSLHIHGRDDVIAVLGLTACGMLASALGSARETRLATRRQLELLRKAARQVEYAGPLASRLEEILAAACAAFPISAAVVRDTAEAVLAGAGVPARRRSPPPSLVWRAGGLEPGVNGGSVPLPAAGVRVALVVGSRQVAWLDLWGDGRRASTETRHVLTALAHVVGALVAAAAALAADEALPPALPDAVSDRWVAVPPRNPPE